MRYALSGSAVFILGRFQYQMVYAFLDGVVMRAGASWVIHFVAGTFWSHALHRSFTFRGEPQQPYLTSLWRTFALYLLVLMLSSSLMILLCDVAGIDSFLGWVVATVVCAVCNFSILSRWTICGVRKEYSNES